MGTKGTSMKLCLTLTGLLTAVAARADDDRGGYETAISGIAGQTKLYGDLGTEREPTYGIQFNWRMPGWPALTEGQKKWRQNLGGYREGIGLSYQVMDTQQHGDQFPFEPAANLRVTLLELTLTPCFLADYPVNLCLGAGIGTSSIADRAHNYQEYGTLPLMVRAEYRFFNVMVGYQIVERTIYQSRADEKSHIGMVTQSITIGWNP